MDSGVFDGVQGRLAVLLLRSFQPCLYFECIQGISVSQLVLTVHLLFSLYCRLVVCLPVINIEAPAPAPCSFLLPSV